MNSRKKRKKHVKSKDIFLPSITNGPKYDPLTVITIGLCVPLTGAQANVPLQTATLDDYYRAETVQLQGVALPRSIVAYLQKVMDNQEPFDILTFTPP